MLKNPLSLKNLWIENITECLILNIALNVFVLGLKWATSLEYDIEDYGITFNSLESGAGSISSFLNIDTYCRQYDYSDRSNFLLGIVLDDLDTCDIFNQDTIFYDIAVELPDNSGPKLTTDKEITDSVTTRPNFSIVELETNLSGSFSMNLFSDDFDNDTLVMSAQGVGFSLDDINGIFSSNNFQTGNMIMLQDVFYSNGCMGKCYYVHRLNAIFSSPKTILYNLQQHESDSSLI